MGIGGSIFLIALGAIIAFGVNADLGWLNLDVVGWVLMFAGVVLLCLTWWFWNRRRVRQRVVAERHVHHHTTAEAPPEAVTISEREPDPTVRYR